ncbi:MAG TPA: CoA transferase [Rhodospirillaceae bacterium]|nr:CoA transferase [Rhodospirillaceae bacterium]
MSPANQDTDEGLPLEGLTVFDAAQGVAGPSCAFLLAQNGANVVKIEPPRGDWVRKAGKKYGDLAAGYVNFNRGKRAICLDFKTEDGLAVARRIASQCDILIESFRPGVMGRFGLDYDTIAEDNPTIIYCSVSGFGTKGPNKDKPVTDVVAQSFTGWMTLNKGNDGVPHKVGMTAMDVITGLYAYQAVSTALYRRATKGVGKLIEMNMMEAAAAFMGQKIIEHVKQDGEITVLGAPTGTFPTADGSINMSAREPDKFEALSNLIGMPELVTDPRFDDWDKRIANVAELTAIISEHTKQKPNAYWMEELDKLDIINGPTATFDDFLSHPQTDAADYIKWIEHEALGSIPMATIPGHTPFEAGPMSHAPHLGEHTEELLAEFGYGANEVAALLESGSAVQFSS